MGAQLPKDVAITPLRHVLLDHLPARERGKVRDGYELPGFPYCLFFVATDRVSSFDIVLPTSVPDKGKVLNAMSLFWRRKVFPEFDTDLLECGTGIDHFLPEELAGDANLQSRSVVVSMLKMFPVECVVRGYLTGSGWKDYQATGRVCGIELRSGLSDGDKLDEPIFTPATKAKTGHDENISFEQMVEIVGQSIADELRRLSLQIYSRAESFARDKGVIIADTKFEFGTIQGQIKLGDEMLTPDSSRFWPADEYERFRTGKRSSLPSYDKQIIRDFIVARAEQTNRPRDEVCRDPLPDEIVAQTTEKYGEIFAKLSGQTLQSFLAQDLGIAT